MGGISQNQIPDSIRPYLDEIVTQLCTGNAALMVGAGFSRNASSIDDTSLPFPDLNQLRIVLNERLYGKQTSEQSKYLPVRELADEAKAVLGHSEFNKLLNDVIPDLSYQPSKLHVKLLELPWSEVFTTNYDTLLERASSACKNRTYSVVNKMDDLLKPQLPRIVKLHGSLHSDEPLIITSEDYRRYPEDYALLVNTVRQAIIENTFCLVGFSGDDPNFLEWTGWLRDKSSRRELNKIFNLGLFDLPNSRKKLHEKRNIIDVNLSDWFGHKLNHFQSFDLLLNYLHERIGEVSNDVWGSNTIIEKPDSGTGWPTGNKFEYPNTDLDKQDQLIELLPYWRNQRESYPGWIIVPEDRRSNLWSATEPWIYYVSNEDSLPDLYDLEFAFEISWRMEKSLCPFLDTQVQFFDSIIERFIDLADVNTPIGTFDVSLESLRKRGLGPDEIRNMVRFLSLRTLRMYREEEWLEKWEGLNTRINGIKSQLSAELIAQLHYEQALLAFFNLDCNKLKKRLNEWPVNENLPYWEAKKAGLLAEIGQVDSAKSILERSLARIRFDSTRNSVVSDYTLVSQESLVMMLLNNARLSESVLAGNMQEYMNSQNEFIVRWDELRKYKCSPHDELRSFTSKLDQPHVKRSQISTKEEFDVGRYTQTYHMIHVKETLTAYNFLRFCEDSGLPFRMPGVNVSTAAAKGAVSRICEYSSFWAMSTLVRVGDEKAVDRIFSRPFLSGLRTPLADNLIDRFVSALEDSRIEIQSGDVYKNINIGIVLAGVIPEILSRLCCKCSQEAKLIILSLLKNIYSSDFKRNYTGIRRLTERLLNSIPIQKRYELIPAILDFPVIDELTQREEREFVNPFRVLNLDRNKVRKRGLFVIGDERYTILLENASSNNPVARKWAIHIIGELYDLGCLNDSQCNEFAEVLWSQLDEFELPSGTDYRRSYFEELPHPEHIDPFNLIRSYIQTEQFPIQNHRTETSIPLTSGELPICDDIFRASRSTLWSEKDSQEMFDRLAEWWDADKEYLKSIEPPGSFGSLRDEFKARFAWLVDILVELLKPSFRISNKKGLLRRIISELSDYGVPAIRLESACLHVFPEQKERVLSKIEIELADDENEVVNDSLGSILIIVRRYKSELKPSEFKKVLNSLGQVVRLSGLQNMPNVLKTISELVTNNPWAFTSELERYTLVGIQKIARNTSVTADTQDSSQKLAVRQQAASLAYELWRFYSGKGEPIPSVISEWKTICSSSGEFAEVRIQWPYLTH